MSPPCPVRSRVRFAALAMLGLPILAQSLPAATLGRFFTSPAERIRLEQIRHAPPVAESEPGPLVAEPEPVAEPAATEPPPEVPGITVNGLVKRSHGRSTVWVNGRSSKEGDLESQYVRVDSRDVGDSVRIDIPVTGDSVRLKPGQTYQPGESRIVDVEGDVAAEKAPSAQRR